MPNGSSPSIHKTQPTTQTSPTSLAEREKLAAQFKVVQAHVVTNHGNAMSIAALGQEVALSNMAYDASNLFGFEPRQRLPGYVRDAAESRKHAGEIRKDHRHVVYSNMAKRATIAEAKARQKEEMTARSHRSGSPRPQLEPSTAVRRQQTCLLPSAFL